MKKITKLLLILTAAVAMVSFTGCSKVNELIGDEGDPWTNISDGWTDNGNTCTYKTSSSTITKGDFYEVYWLLTFNFSNDLCTAAKWEYACPNSTVAKIVYEELEDEYHQYVKVSGRMLTIDLSEDFIGIEKNVIKAGMDYWKASY